MGAPSSTPPPLQGPPPHQGPPLLKPPHPSWGLEDGGGLGEVGFGFGCWSSGSQDARGWSTMVSLRTPQISPPCHMRCTPQVRDGSSPRPPPGDAGSWRQRATPRSARRALPVRAVASPTAPDGPFAPTPQALPALSGAGSGPAGRVGHSCCTPWPYPRSPRDPCKGLQGQAGSRQVCCTRHHWQPGWNKSRGNLLTMDLETTFIGTWELETCVVANSPQCSVMSRWFRLI